MNANNDTSHVLLTVEKYHLRLYIKIANQIIQDQNFFVKSLEPELVFFTLLNLSRKLFFQYLPIESLEVMGSSKILHSGIKKLSRVVRYYMNVVIKTNELMLQQKNKNIRNIERNNILVVNINDNQYMKELMDYIGIHNNNKIFYQNYSTGFDLNTREYKPVETEMNLTEILQYLFDNKIKIIITLNYSMQDQIMRFQETYLLPILNCLNIQLISIVWDSISIRYFKKQAFCFEKNKCYYIYPGIEQNFNQLVGMTKVRYFPIFPIKKVEYIQMQLSDSFQILCAANSRIDVFLQKEKLALVLAAFEFCRAEQTFYDFQLWFFSILYFLMHKMELPSLQKVICWTTLRRVFFNGISILKYEALLGLQTDRKVLLFGDQGWQELFPEYFQDRYLSQDELYSFLGSGKYLYLQMNDVFSYPESNPVVMHAIRMGAVFLGFPAVVKLPEIAGFEIIEYRNSSELNRKINSASEIMLNGELEKAIHNYIKVMNRVTENFLGSLLIQGSTYNNEYINYCDQHHKLFEPIAEKYIRQFGDRLRNYITNLFKMEYEFKLQQSWMYEKPYIQKILQKVKG